MTPWKPRAQRPEYNAIYEELEQVEGELRKALGEEGRKSCGGFPCWRPQLRNMSYGDYFAEGFHLALALLRGGPCSPPA